MDIGNTLAVVVPICISAIVGTAIFGRAKFGADKDTLKNHGDSIKKLKEDSGEFKVIFGKIETHIEYIKEDNKKIHEEIKGVPESIVKLFSDLSKGKKKK